MAKTLGVWGIDIGQCALKALRLEVIDGVPTATAFDYVEHPKILSQPDADPDALTREALEKFLSRNPVGKDHLAIGVPGQAGLVRFVKLPPVEEKKVTDIVKFEAKQQIPFPLEEVVWDYQRLSEKQEVIGGFAMETEIGLFAMKRDIINRHLAHYQGVRAEVHAVQMAPLALANYATYELLKKRGDASAEEPAGDLPPGKKKRCVVVLDIGTEGSNLIITDGARVIWQRPVPLGGNNFTRVLTKELKLTFAKAEHLKRNAAKSPDLAQILKALRPVLTDFVGEVQRSLGYFTNTHRDAHVAYMVGLGSAFKLPGLQKYLSEKLSLEVRKPTKIDGVQGEAVLGDAVFQENVLTFPVAYGLALQGLALQEADPEAGKRFALLRTNLLPQEIHIDRLIRAKKPWAAAAAACLLAGVGVLAAGVGCQYRAATDASLLKAWETADGAVKAGTTQNGEFAKKEGEVTSKRAEVKALVAGNEERLNWIRLNEVVSAALPRPPLRDEAGNLLLGVDKKPLDEGNMTWPARGGPGQEPWQAQEYYLDLAGANAAISKYADRVRSGVPADKLFENTRVELLPLVNLEAIDCRYTDNLQGFLDAANTQADKKYGVKIVTDLMDARPPEPKDGSPPADPNVVKLPAERDPADPPNVRGDQPWHKYNPKAPTGAGWVIEVRGYTYHQDAHTFVRHTLVRNLQEMAEYAKLTGPDDVGKIIPDLKGKDPVLGKVSHAFLYGWEVVKAAELKKDQVPKLNLSVTSQLDALVPAAAAGTDPNAPPATGSSSSSYSGSSSAPPMPGSEGNTGTAVAGWPGMLGGPRAGASSLGSGAESYFGSSSSSSSSTAEPPAGGGAVPTNPKNTKQLTGFIVYFIWQEPAPATDATAPPK